jgi:hypothetical protein
LPQEWRKGTRVQVEVVVQQESALKSAGCLLTCVYDAVAQRLLRVDIRGRRESQPLQKVECGEYLFDSLMQMLQGAGEWYRLCSSLVFSVIYWSQYRADVLVQAGNHEETQLDESVSAKGHAEEDEDRASQIGEAQGEEYRSHE